jgi:hypothetical protein
MRCYAVLRAAARAFGRAVKPIIVVTIYLII